MVVCSVVCSVVVGRHCGCCFSVELMFEFISLACFFSFFSFPVVCHVSIVPAIVGQNY